MARPFLAVVDERVLGDFGVRGAEATSVACK